jgi:excisionase family DNA binding protein
MDRAEKHQGNKQDGSGNDVHRQLAGPSAVSQEDDMAEEEMTILTAKEAADYLRVSLYTLRRMERDGSLIPFRTPGGHRRYSLKMLNEYLESSRISSHRRQLENMPVLQ